MEKKEKERNIEKKGGLALFTAPNSMINEHRFQGKFNNNNNNIRFCIPPRQNRASKPKFD